MVQDFTTIGFGKAAYAWSCSFLFQGVWRPWRKANR